MNQVEFRVGAQDPLAYACGLLRAAVAKGARLVVRLDPGALDAFDARLWTFSQAEFLPHCRQGDALEDRTPIVLTAAADVSAIPGRDCLVNLASDLPAGWQTLARVIEVVGAADDDKAAARMRYRGYRKAGCEPVTLEIEVRNPPSL